MSSASSVPPLSTVATFPIPKLRESPMNPRKYFDAKALKELSASVADHGVLEPLVIRLVADADEAEIICGARRYRAAKLAGLTEVPVVMRQLSDDDVQVIQLVENGQREDLSPIEAAETYAALAEKGLTPKEIAKRVSRDVREVTRWLPLAKLGKKCKASLAEGTLPVEYAILIARLPDQKLHDEALAAIAEEWYDSDAKGVRLVAYPAAKRIIEEQFMTALSVAVFDPEDETLSPLGPCSKCPHLTGNSRDLFGDVKGKAICTYPKDFRVKTEAQLKRLREAGNIVLITPNELKRAFPNGSQLSREYIDLESVCGYDPKFRTYAELLGRAASLTTVYALKDGRVRRLYPAKEMKPGLVAAGHRFAKDKPSRETKSGLERSAAQLESIGEDAVSRELALKLRTVKLTPSGWTDLALRSVVLVQTWKLEPVFRRHGFDGTREEFANDREKIVAERLEAMSEAEKRSLMIDLLAGDWSRSADKAHSEMYRHLLKLANIDRAKVANAAIEEAKRNAAEAKKTPKPPIAAKVIRAPKEKR